MMNMDGVLIPDNVKHRQGRDNDRLELLSPSLHHRDEVLAVRRCVFSLCGLQEEVAGNWLAVSDMRRRKGDLHGARAALKHSEASGLDAETALIKECILVKESGDIHGAIALLEPRELDVAASRTKFRRLEASCSGHKTEEEKLEQHHLARRLFLTAKWLSLSHAKHGRAIIDRYKLALDLHKDWEAANFELAKYFEIVAEMRKEELDKKSGGGAVKRSQALEGDDIFLTNSVVSAFREGGRERKTNECRKSEGMVNTLTCIIFVASGLHCSRWHITCMTLYLWHVIHFCSYLNFTIYSMRWKTI